MRRAGAILKAWLFERRSAAWVRFAVFTCLSAVLWEFNANAVQDTILWLAFAAALWIRPRGSPAWRCGAGLTFAAVLIYTVAGLPLSVSPRESAGDLLKVLDILAAAFALPVLLDDDNKAAGGLLYAACGLTVILGCDLVRLAVRLKGDLLAGAHEYEPFVLGHSPNIGALAAGLAFVMLSGAALRLGRARPAPVAACAAGMLIDLAYLIVIASRGAQVAFGVTVVAAGLLLVRGAAARVAWLLIVAVAAAVLIARPEWVNRRFKDAISMRGFSDRDKVWSHTWRLARERPVFGYGYGHKVFGRVYHGSNPPAARFHFVHPHQYWLNVLFAQGWVGLGLYLAAWAQLMVRLLRRCFARGDDLAGRSLSLTILLALVFIHAFGLGDFPGSIARTLMIWMIPMALVATRDLGGPARHGVS